MEVDTNELLHRIGAVLRVMSDKMDRLIAIGERVEGEVRLPSEEEAQTFANVLRNDTCISSDAVSREPPKKWRILEPGEVVCSSDLVNAKSNSPSDPPNGLGWIPVIASVGISVCEDDLGIYARPISDEPAKEPEPEYREPVLPADAGKECEVSDDGKTWVGGKVYGWRVAPDSWWAWGRWHRFARIKVDA